MEKNMEIGFYMAAVTRFYSDVTGLLGLSGCWGYNCSSGDPDGKDHGTEMKTGLLCRLLFRVLGFGAGGLGFSGFGFMV